MWLEPEQLDYCTEQGIKFYTGDSARTKRKYLRNIELMKRLISSLEPNAVENFITSNEVKLFNELIPSTLTAQGMLTNVAFNEKDIIDDLPDPTGNIMLIGCNFGIKQRADFVKPEIVAKSGRGRKPKVKPESTRKRQGTGKFFSSQITFQIQHESTSSIYKIKLFRNGKSQIPGVKDPNMHDIIEPLRTMKEYIAANISPDVEISHFCADMRNYKCRIVNEDTYVDLDVLETVLSEEKHPKKIQSYLNYLLEMMPEEFRADCKSHIGKTNIMNIAEISYNNDKCFNLSVKFYRPVLCNRQKKTTVNLLKKGKINFGGGNSELEVMDIYYWLEYLYLRNAAKILVNITKIRNEFEPELLQMWEACPNSFIFN